MVDKWVPPTGGQDDLASGAVGAGNVDANRVLAEAQGSGAPLQDDNPPLRPRGHVDIPPVPGG